MVFGIWYICADSDGSGTNLRERMYGNREYAGPSFSCQDFAVPLYIKN